MGIQMNNICPNCFSFSFHRGECSKCGFSISENTVYEMGLRIHSILKDRYIIGNVLGRGGFGITYKAYDLDRQEICAVKEYCPKFLNLGRNNNLIRLENQQEKGKYDHGKMRFIEEAQVLFRIRKYPYVVKIRDSFYENNTYYYVMDFIDGINLKRVVAGEHYRYSVNDATNVILKLGNTLQTIYEQEGLIHRDISPENILIDKKVEYTLIDFGSAKEIIEGEKQEFSVVLKPGFAPLEQYSETMPQGSYTDVYALAGTYYFMLTGRMLPNAIDRMNHPEVYIPLDRMGINIDHRISEIVSRALEVSYKQRTQTIKQFLDELASADINDPYLKQNSQSQTKSMGKKNSGYLEVVSGTDIGRRWILPDDGEVRVAGRDSNRCHIVISYEEVSRKHFEIRFDSERGEFIGRDCSTNGIFVDDEYYSGTEFRVKPGCIIQFPQTECVLYLGVRNE